MKTNAFIASVLLIGINANAASQFCAPNAAAAAQALANANGTVSETVVQSQSKDGKTFRVVLAEKGLGQDTYLVKTAGGHDCTAFAIQAVGSLTARP